MAETKKIIGLLATAGLACGFTGIGMAIAGSSPLTSQLMTAVLGGFSVNLANSFADKLNFKRIREWFVKTHPDNLNHDLQIVLLSSILRAIDNIQLLYSPYVNESKNRELNTLVKQFKKEIADTFPVKKDETLSKSELATLLYNDADKAIKELLALVPEVMQSFDTLNAKVPFSSFFKENILPQFQLCFAETLKDPKNSRAWTAFQRFLLEDINAGIKELLQKQQAATHEIISAIDKKAYPPKLSSKQVKQLTLLSKKLNNPIRLSNEMTAALDNYIGYIKSDIRLLLSAQKEHYELSQQHFNLSKEQLLHTTKVGEQVSVIQQIILDNKKRNTWLLASVITVLVIVAAIVAFSLKNSSTFNATLVLVKDPEIAMEKSYPAIRPQSQITLQLDSKTSAEVSSDNKAMFMDIKNNYLDKKVRIILEDKYWETSAKEISLKKGIVNVYVRPNTELAGITGRVLSRDGKQLIADAKIIVDGIVFHTGANGNFEYTMPVHLRKEKYVLRVEKNGYETTEVEYLPGLRKEIRMSKL